MRYTINLDCKTHHVDRNGEVPILMRISINGKHDYINTGKKIKIHYYDKERKSIKSGVKGSTILSSFIDRQKVKLDIIISEFERKGDVATIEKVKGIYLQETGKIKSECFFDYVSQTIEWERKHSSISKDTLRNYVIYLNNLKAYKSKLSIHDIDKDFLEKYKSHILENLKQAKNTAYHAMCFIRKYTKKLLDDGKIKSYPFAKFQVGSPFEVEIEYLEPEELTRLHNLYDSHDLTKIVRKAENKHTRYKEFKVGEKYQEVLRYFLVSCYCGLRHSDIKTLCQKDITGDYIVKEMQKGRNGRKKTVRIPIRKRLLSLLDLKNTNGLVFENPVMEDSQTNKYLKEIMKIANINKHITFHCSRHTFSVISLLKGISIVVISDILGHSELTTTQRYARVVDRLREQEMDKWDDPEKNLCEIYCSDCGKKVLQFESGIINLNSIPLVCQACTTPFTYNLKQDLLNCSEIEDLSMQS